MSNFPNLDQVFELSLLLDNEKLEEEGFLLDDEDREFLSNLDEISEEEWERVDWDEIESRPLTGEAVRKFKLVAFNVGYKEIGKSFKCPTNKLWLQAFLKKFSGNSTGKTILAFDLVEPVFEMSYLAPLPLEYPAIFVGGVLGQISVQEARRLDCIWLVEESSLLSF